ncbi:hypothetical protein K3I30_004696 [Salmonella enterica subsp. enterica serovar Mikawasima]|nr:hypothetical protein [Salmonella enterica subsp. enterica serovar Mikawasima]EHV6746697.1 hypothetical protein [Salmonella enterica subsp. enterica serovar Mikawasima]EHW7260955.1 hypothetical protein [Salmonella enterica subsp. enterica serovar Mikawasima]EHW7264678.1 hypothetical protein [Salmonella enterica subsp. enterica serovar Mikawasima]
MNVKIRNEIQALIRIQERNNNGGELREFICAREVDGYGEKTYLITFDHCSIWARCCYSSLALKAVQLSLRHIPASLREPLLY